MRPYFHKILIEKERSNSSAKSKKWRQSINPKSLNEDLDDFDSGINRAPMGMESEYGWNCKNLSDNIRPLLNYLDSKVGKHWDDVWSEICKAIPKGLHGDHIQSHVFSYVEKNCYEGVDGFIYAQGHYFSSPHKVEGLYIHPDTGILSRQSFKTRRQRKHENEAKIIVDCVILDNYLDKNGLKHIKKYELINKIWFYCEYHDIDKSYFINIKLHKYIDLMVQTVKKQLNHKELIELRQNYLSK